MGINIIDTVKKAGALNKIVSIRYIDSKGTISERMIEPYEIKEGKLYGYCLKSDGTRAFKLDNILGATMTESSFVPRWPIQL
jgi:predicted DNA-binding transcriptional regulator YafY